MAGLPNTYEKLSADLGHQLLTEIFNNPLITVEAIDYGLSQKADPNVASGSWKNTALHIYIANESTYLALAYVAAVKKWKLKLDFTRQDSQEKTILLFAAKTRNFKVLNSLLDLLEEQIPDVEERRKVLAIGDTLGRTALHHACLLGPYAAVERLVRSGASISVQDTLGRTPLHETLALPAEINHRLRSVYMEPQRYHLARLNAVTFKVPFHKMVDAQADMQPSNLKRWHLKKLELATPNDKSTGKVKALNCMANYLRLLTEISQKLDRFMVRLLVALSNREDVSDTFTRYKAFRAEQDTYLNFHNKTPKKQRLQWIDRWWGFCRAFFARPEVVACASPRTVSKKEINDLTFQFDNFLETWRTYDETDMTLAEACQKDRQRIAQFLLKAGESLTIKHASGKTYRYDQIPDAWGVSYEDSTLESWVTGPEEKAEAGGKPSKIPGLS